MTPLRLDYQRSMKPIPWGGALLLAIALAALALNAASYHYLDGKITYWEEEAGRLGRMSGQRISGSQRETAETALEIKHANEVLRRISLPWGKLFQAVESSSGKEVALLALEPDAEKHEVKISGEAKNIGAVLGYIKHLEAQDVFSRVYLQNHQIQLQDPERPVRFALLAAWKVAP